MSNYDLVSSKWDEGSNKHSNNFPLNPSGFLLDQQKLLNRFQEIPIKVEDELMDESIKEECLEMRDDSISPVKRMENFNEDEDDEMNGFANQTSQHVISEIDTMEQERKLKEPGMISQMSKSIRKRMRRYRNIGRREFVN
eukprot:TRINITY_DN8538_c0_g1_i8.p1 TRINITY_DN8538_c0_g1~~TRINITY_DN8538_c0_g1_i8.p1  ORF type:complete len:140 (+),score=22.28 TRINITY_DN8538_c0_g1_i8:198-617(+)